VGRNATAVRLAVSSNGVALVSYRTGGKAVRLRAWGATDARTPSASRAQVAFKVRYGRPARVASACRPYSGPALSMLVAACTAPDGSYWALQSWQRNLPNYGVAPKGRENAWELRLSHWHGPLAELTLWPEWVDGGRVHSLFGRLMYAGVPVYGFKSNRYGASLDSYGRNLYLDTLNSAYGPGWRRENAFLTHRGTGLYCYGFFPFKSPRRTSAVAGQGERYRLTVIGPGLTPDMRWEVDGLANFDPSNPALVAFDQETKQIRKAMLAGDRTCRY
jgi:hypothetical protein